MTAIRITRIIAPGIACLVAACQISLGNIGTGGSGGSPGDAAKPSPSSTATPDVTTPSPSGTAKPDDKTKSPSPSGTVRPDDTAKPPSPSGTAKPDDTAKPPSPSVTAKPDDTAKPPSPATSPAGQSSPAPTPSGTTAGGPSAPPSGQAILEVEPTSLVGVLEPLHVRLLLPVDQPRPGPSVTVQVVSGAEPAGEAISLTETAPRRFEGDVPLERPFDESGGAVAIAGNKRVAVYAEGSNTGDTLTVGYGTISQAVGYTEPPSTLTGIVKVGGQAVGGALVEIEGDNGVVRRTVSRSDGSYAFHDVPAGTYQVIAAAKGAVQTQKKVPIPAGP